MHDDAENANHRIVHIGERPGQIGRGLEVPELVVSDPYFLEVV